MEVDEVDARAGWARDVEIAGEDGLYVVDRAVDHRRSELPS